MPLRIASLKVLQKSVRIEKHSMGDSNTTTQHSTAVIASLKVLAHACARGARSCMHMRLITTTADFNVNEFVLTRARGREARPSLQLQLA